jgi:penicillin-binding protein 1C
VRSTSPIERRWLRRGGWAIAAAALLCCGLRLLPAPLLVNRAGMSQLVLARDGSLLRLSLAGDDHYRLWTPLEEIPDAVVDATLLQEDRFFFRHPGINPGSLLRAVNHTYLRGDRRLGASTLTMQLARMRFDLDTRSWRGKLVQMFYALVLELRFSKRELLEAYLNLAPYGGNVEGVGAASWLLFGKPPTALSPAEALTLAVIPKSPAARTPFSAAGRAALAAARQRLAAAWNQRHAPLAPAVVSAVQLRERDALPYRAAHLADRLTAADPFAGRIATTIDPAVQRLVEQQLAAWRVDAQRVGVRNAAVLVADHRSMDVLAYVGSADHGDAAIQGAVDGVRARRSPGSALKPFLYGLALDAGLINPETMLEDTSLTISSWNPENFDRDFLGPISATDALVRSRNLPAVQLANRLPAPGLYGFLAAAHIGGLRSADFYGLALTLGGVEVRLDELVRLYAMLASGGVDRDLVWSKDVSHGGAETRRKDERAVSCAGVDGDHAPRLREVNTESEGSDSASPRLRLKSFAGDRLLSPEAAYLVLDMLRANPRPGDEARLQRRSRVAWKTGTSFGFRDAWAVGIAGRFAIGVWAGNFDGTPNPAFVGRETAGPLFFRIVDALRARDESFDLPPPPHGVVPAEVCALSGAPPGDHCPGHKHTWVIAGRSPIGTCSVHREVAIDLASGLRACPDQLQNVRQEVYEFWPSHLLSLFRRVGIARRTPPPYAPQCGGRAGNGRPLRIDSPQARLIYALRDGARDEIPFSAVADADGRRVSWFVDDAYVGQSQPGTTYFWPARPGSFVVRAVDELGRSVAQPLKVELVGN